VNQWPWAVELPTVIEASRATIAERKRMSQKKNEDEEAKVEDKEMKEEDKEEVRCPLFLKLSRLTVKY